MEDPGRRAVPSRRSGAAAECVGGGLPPPFCFPVCYPPDAMGAVPRLLVIAALLLLGSVLARATGAQAPAPPAAASAQGSLRQAIDTPSPLLFPPAGNPDFLGSPACERCHQDDYAQWQRSLHIRMTKPIAEAAVVGDFTPGGTFSDHGRSYEFGRKDGKPWVKVTAGGTPAQIYAVDYALGFKRYQGYLSTLPDGRIYVLPVFWHLASRRWVDWKETTPVPDGAHDFKQIWNVNCFNCHGTNLAQGYQPATKTYKSSWTEMGIGCEACHGPGRAHVALMEAWEKDPSLKAGLDLGKANPTRSEILKTFAVRGAPSRQVFDTCAYCHGNKRNVFVGFTGGGRYDDFAVPFLLSEPLPEFDTQGEFWPDGRPIRFNRPQALMQSGCFQAGAVACINCHVAHGSRNDFSLKLNINQGRSGDLLCTQCHQEQGAGDRGQGTGGPQAAQSPGLVRAGSPESPGSTEVSAAAPASPPAAGQQALSPDPRPRDPAVRIVSRSPDADGSARPWTNQQIERHTFHPAASPGSRCINCHMSDVNWRLLIRRRDHTFRPPVPEVTATHGIPNACTTCHDDKPPEWAAAQMDGWWGDAARRREVVDTADTFYRAGAGDTSVAPQLAAIAIDRRRSAFLRASAADYLARMARGLREGSSAQSQTSFGGARAGSARPVTASPAGRLVLDRTLTNTMIGAASDPEAVVRAAALRALGASPELQDPRVVAAVTARLVDRSRVVRAQAAEILLALGTVQLPGAAGLALAHALDDHAQALAAFPESVANVTELAWLQAERGQDADAEALVGRALALDATRARPWVIRGVLAARQARMADAVSAWKKARELEPGYPNLDKMLEEAGRRTRR